MNNKELYKKAMSGITASEQFKQELIKQLADIKQPEQNEQTVINPVKAIKPKSTFFTPFNIRLIAAAAAFVFVVTSLVFVGSRFPQLISKTNSENSLYTHDSIADVNDSSSSVGDDDSNKDSKGNGSYERSDTGDLGQASNNYISSNNSEKKSSEDSADYGMVTNADSVVITVKEEEADYSAAEEVSAELASAFSHYSGGKNPLWDTNRNARNGSTLPSFDINQTYFVRKGTSLADLNKKTLNFFTADDREIWEYYTLNGKTVGEWTWFKNLKSEIGLSVKYTISDAQQTVDKAMSRMMAGKKLDIIYCDITAYPLAVIASKPLTNLINIDNNGSSPLVSKQVMDITKWNTSYRVIAPVGSVDLLWYNRTMGINYKLTDPHQLWIEGQWNWNIFKSLMLSLPKKTPSGKTLVAFAQKSSTALFAWPATNGFECVSLGLSDNPHSIVDKWADSRTAEALEFINSVVSRINYSTDEAAHLGLFRGTTYMSATILPQTYYDTKYLRNMSITWVPYPKAPGESGCETARFIGYSMLLPKVTSDTENVNIALKFMELWATRYSQAIFDNYQAYEYYGSYDLAKEIWEYSIAKVTHGLTMTEQQISELNNDYLINLSKKLATMPDYEVKNAVENTAKVFTDYILNRLESYRMYILNELN